MAGLAAIALGAWTSSLPMNALVRLWRHLLWMGYRHATEGCEISPDSVFSVWWSAPSPSCFRLQGGVTGRRGKRDVWLLWSAREERHLDCSTSRFGCSEKRRVPCWGTFHRLKSEYQALH